MKWFAIFAAFAVAVGVAAIAFHDSATTFSHRYKRTISIEVNGVVHTGANVIEVTWLQQPQNLPISLPRFVANVHGDGTVVDLGDGRALVALLGPADPLDVPTPPEFAAMRAFGLPDDDSSIPLISKQTGTRQLAGKDIPALIVFSDINDPSSARLVKLNGRERDLAAGLRLLAAKIEITSEPVTREIDKKLPWWSMNGRPAVVAWRAWLEGRTAGPATEPETLFRRR